MSTEPKPEPSAEGWRLNLTGKRFGRWTALKYVPKAKWLCRCDCGKEYLVRTWDLTGRASTQCRPCACTKHGFIVNHKQPSTYGIWKGIKYRCLNSKSANFHRYGGRGIKICDRWKKFEGFLADMGERPAGKSIHRINNDGNYEPGNCKWATRPEQDSNKSTHRWLSVGGQRRYVAETIRLLGVSRDQIYRGLKLGGGRTIIKGVEIYE